MNTSFVAQFDELSLEERTQVKEMTKEILQSFVSGVTPEYSSDKMPLLIFTSMYIDESGFVEVTGGTSKSLMAGFSYGKLTEKGKEYLKQANQE